MGLNRRPRLADWRATLGVGALLGAVVLGIGSRIGMRIVAVAQGGTGAFTIEGTLTVVMFGAITGVVVAIIFLASRTAFPNHRPGRVLLFWALLTAFVLRGISPLTWLTFTAFAPLFLVHGGLLTLYWCRLRLRGTDGLPVRRWNHGGSEARSRG